MTGYVTGLYIGNSPGTIISRALTNIVADLEGFPGDRHYGHSKPAGVREKLHPRGATIFNPRQVSIVSEEELTTIGERLGIDPPEASLYGANIRTLGIPDLTQLPPLSRLLFPSGASILIYGENLPCQKLADTLAPYYPQCEHRLVKESLGLRGLVGWVERAGLISTDDEIRVVRARTK